MLKVLVLQQSSQFIPNFLIILISTVSNKINIKLVLPFALLIMVKRPKKVTRGRLP
jgi:hypothetical protein